VIEHASVLCDALPIDVEHLPQHFARRQLRADLADTAPMTMREIELRAIERAMTRHNGNKKAVAEELGMSLKTLYNKLNAASEASEAA